MKFLESKKSCETCYHFELEDTTWMAMVYPGTDCLYLYGAETLTRKNKGKIQKALLRYNRNEDHPYCKFWVSKILSTLTYKDIRKKGTEFFKSVVKTGDKVD